MRPEKPEAHLKQLEEQVQKPGGHQEPGTVPATPESSDEPDRSMRPTLILIPLACVRLLLTSRLPRSSLTHVAPYPSVPADTSPTWWR